MRKIKKLIKITERELNDFSLPAIEKFLKKCGYTTLYIGTPEAETEIKRYNLELYAKKKNAFIFCSAAKFVFIKKDFHYKTKQLLLLHELGHILLGHIGDGKSIYTEEIEAEAEADAFACTLIKRNERKIKLISSIEDAFEKVFGAIRTLLPFVLIAGLLVAIIYVSVSSNTPPNNKIVTNSEATPKPTAASGTTTYTDPEPQSTVAPTIDANIVYITPFGECYHLAICGLKGNNAIPINRDDINGRYRPCSRCRP